MSISSSHHGSTTTFQNHFEWFGVIKSQKDCHRLSKDWYVLDLLTEFALDEILFAQTLFISQSCAAKPDSDLYSIVKNFRFASVSTLLSIVNSPSLIRNESHEGKP
jgi:hypothetical protein